MNLKKTGEIIFERDIVKERERDRKIESVDVCE